MTDHVPPALIFAAGFGTRMGDMTKTRPKPMLDLCDRPMIDYSVDLLRQAGVTRLVANTHYLHDVIAPHLSHLGVDISHETPNILDTGGGLRKASGLFNDGAVITMNPDAAWRGKNPIQTLLDAWRPQMRALLLVVPETQAIGRRLPGDFDLSSGHLSRRGGYVYTGVQMIDPTLTHEVNESAFSLNVIWDKLINENALHGVVYDGEWCDIGHPDGLAEAEKLLGCNHV